MTMNRRLHIARYGIETRRTDRAGKPRATTRLVRHRGVKLDQVKIDHEKSRAVVVAFSSQPRVGSAVTDDMSLIEIMRPRVFGLLTSICLGSHVCWLIFWCGAGL